MAKPQLILFLFKAMEEPLLAYLSWEKACDMLPDTPSTRKQRAEYKSSEDSAFTHNMMRNFRLDDRINKWEKVIGGAHELPWVIAAKEMMPELSKDSSRRSCVRSFQNVINHVAEVSLP